MKTPTGLTRLLLRPRVLGALALAATPALAAQNDGVTQIDGDAKASTSDPSFRPGVGNSVYLSPSSMFTGGGSAAVVLPESAPCG